MPIKQMELNKLTTLSLLEWRLAQSAAEQAVAYAEQGEWKNLTWAEYASLVKLVSRRLQEAGFRRAARIAIFSETRFEWAVLDLAVQSFGAVVVAIHPSYSVEEVLHTLRVSQAEAIFCGGERPLQTIQEVLAESERHFDVYSFDETDAAEALSIKSYRDFVSGGIDAGLLPADAASTDPCSVGEEELATIVFTSGTSSLPKAVCLTQKNLVATAIASYCHLEHRISQPKSLHWLPFAHLFGRIGIYLDLVSGCSATYSRGLAYLPEDIKLAQPHFIFAVPKALARFQSAILAQVQTQSSLKRKIFHGSLRVVQLTGRRKSFKAADKVSQAVDRLIKRTVFAKVIESFGGNLQLIITGSAPVEPQLCQFFESFGIKALEGYGMTETSGVAFVNPYNQVQVGTVGTAIGTVRFRIDADRELLLRGESICRGYLNPEDNSAAFTADGWFRTGDLADVDAKGYLKIVGRKKDIIITDGGENIPPERIEAKLMSYPLIKDAVVLGDRRPFLVAIINVDSSHFRASSNGHVEPQSPELIKAVQGIVNEVNRSLAKFETVKNFFLTDEEFSVERGELTQTLKKRRKVIEQHYHAEIEMMYRQPFQTVQK